MKQYIVDAFTDQVFKGNPAAVCIMDEWISDELMTNIAIENNLSETAFAVKEGDHYHLRWFTPGGEIDFCGHATLGTSFVILTYYEPDKDEVRYNTLHGELVVRRNGDIFDMYFPAYELEEVPVTEAMVEATGGHRPIKAFMARDLLCIFEDEEVVRNMNVDQEKVKALDGLLLHVSAPGKKYDCVSRSFAPKLMIAEDPVCGSGHCHIVPYWTKELGKQDIVAYQASKRGGVLYCHQDGNDITLSGKVVKYSESEIL